MMTEFVVSLGCECAVAPLLGDCNLRIRALSGEEVFAFQVPVTHTIKQVKLRIWEECGAHFFTQQVVHPNLGILGDGISMQELQELHDPIEVLLVRLPFDDEKGPLLFNPAFRGDAAAVQWILGDAAHPDHARVADGCTPLVAAASNGHLEVVRFLCEAGADKEKPKQDGATPLFIAAYQGHLEVVRFLCKAGADKDKQTQDGMTPLIIAAHNGHVKVENFLREKRDACVMM